MSIEGLPALPSALAQLFSTVEMITSDFAGLSVAAPQWGIFLNGAAVVSADSVVSMEFNQDFEISDYPIEQGSFASYNKVQRPFITRLRFSTGGSIGARAAFLNSISAIIGDTNLYDVVTPEVTYTSLNLIHQDYVRSADRGAGLVSVDVWCREVRPASLSTSTSVLSTQTGNSGTTTPVAGSPNSIVSSDFAVINSPQSPGASAQANGGNVQPLTPTTAQQSAAQSVLAQSMLPF